MKKERAVIGVRMAVGATGKDISRSLLFEILIFTLLAAGLVLATILPLAKLFGVDEMIILDGTVAAEFLVLVVCACELLAFAVVRTIKSKQIAELMKMRDDS